MTTSGTPSTSATPGRRLPLREEHGCRILSADRVAWADGEEEEILSILDAVGDRSALSDELAARDETWAQRYHFARERGHVARPFDLDGLTVLEVGAGCGAVTRHLGEVAAVVDALEPSLIRAQAARRRTEDLESVEVFVGELADLPPEPAYDVILFIGVIEWVGERDDVAGREAILREAVMRLLPGGSVIVAIENRLGAKYLAGAPEDHAGYAFEGIERYPHGGPFRTFSRLEIERLLAAAGLDAEVFHAFPDYKHPRLVFRDSLLDSPASALAWRAASFPSPASPLPRPRLASEYQLWRGAVEGGLGRELANSFVVVGRRPQSAPIWPDGVHAQFYSNGRRSASATTTVVAEGPDGLELRRRHLSAGPSERREGGLTHRCHDAPFVEGVPLIELLERAGHPQLEQLLAAWHQHIRGAASAAGELPIDLTPGNIVVTDRGMVDVDTEWSHDGYATDDVVERALLHLAIDLSDRRPPGDWPPGCTTVGELLAHLGELAGIGVRDRDALIRREAELQAQVGHQGPASPLFDAVADTQEEALRELLARPLELGELGLREHELRVRAEVLTHEQAGTIEYLEHAVAELDAARETVQQAYQSMEQAYLTVVTSRSWRSTEFLRGLGARLRRRR